MKRSSYDRLGLFLIVAALVIGCGLSFGSLFLSGTNANRSITEEKGEWTAVVKKGGIEDILYTGILRTVYVEDPEGSPVQYRVLVTPAEYTSLSVGDRIHTGRYSTVDALRQTAASAPFLVPLWAAGAIVFAAMVYHRVRKHI